MHPSGQQTIDEVRQEAAIRRKISQAFVAGAAMASAIWFIAYVFFLK